MRRVLVTGARGFIARHLAQHLTSLGYEVVGVDRKRDSVVGPIEGISRLVITDLLDTDQTIEAVAEADPSIVVHLAAQQVGIEGDGGQGRPSVDVAMTANLLAAANQSRNVRHILFASSAAIYDRSEPMPVAETAAIKPDSTYGESKAAAEVLVRAFAVGSRTATVLRLANVVGSGERRPSVVSSVSRQIAAIEAGKRNDSVWHGRLDGARDLVDVRDVSRAIASCCRFESGGARTYNVGTGRAVAISDIVDALVRMSFLPLRLELDPSLVRTGPVTRIALDSTALRAAVGWLAEVPLKRSLADVLNYWRHEVRDQHQPPPARLSSNDHTR